MKRGSPAPKLADCAQCGYKSPLCQARATSSQETRWKSKSWPQEGPRASSRPVAASVVQQQSREREPLRPVGYHGVSRSVCSVAALTAAGVKGSAKVVALYQAGHWSR